MSQGKNLAWSLSGLGAGVACVIALIQSNGNLVRGNVVLLGVLGAIFFFLGAVGLGWHKAPLPIGTPIRTLLLLALCACLMAGVCWRVWPKSAEEVQADTRREIEEALKEMSHYRVDVQPCRGENLADCSDDQLFQWGSSLSAKMSEAMSRFTDTAKQAAMESDLRIRVGLYHVAGAALARDFKDCCADDALRYFKETPLRFGGGYSHDNTAEWLEDITQRPSLFRRVLGTKELTETDGLKAGLAWLQTIELQNALEKKIKDAKSH